MAASPGVLEDMKSLFLGDETAVWVLCVRTYE
jgi:hypothetical protein